MLSSHSWRWLLFCGLMASRVVHSGLFLLWFHVTSSRHITSHQCTHHITSYHITSPVNMKDIQWLRLNYNCLLFIENDSKFLIGWEQWMKSSYPLGSCPNLELCHHHRILKTHIWHYDVICSYIENTYTTLRPHTNLCCLCQMRKNTNGRLLQGKVLQIQINNKTIIEFGSRRIWGIIKASVCVICLSLRQITQTSALIIPHILREPNSIIV